MSKDSILSRALARIDELEAENASLRGAVVVKPNERLVIIAPEHVSKNGLLQMFDGFYRRYVGQVIVLAHDWRTIPIDDLRKTLESSMPVARTEQAQGSTTVRRMGDFGVEVVEVQDERFCPSCGCQGGVHHGWCKS